MLLYYWLKYVPVSLQPFQGRLQSRRSVDCREENNSSVRQPVDINGGVRRQFGGKGLRETTRRCLHGELIPNMRLTSLMMSIASALLLLFYACVGPAGGAPRIYSYDASAVSRKPDTWENLRTDLHPSSPKVAIGTLGEHRSPPDIIFTDSRTAEFAAIMTPRVVEPSGGGGGATIVSDEAADSGINAGNEEERVWLSRGSGTQKRSADLRASLLAPEKMLQTMVSMVSQRTSNDAWAADSIDSSVTSEEHVQGGCCEQSGNDGFL